MKVYDLSHPFSMDMSVWPGTPKMKRTLSHTIEKDLYNLGLYSINSHAGTHTDAPLHYIANGKSLAEVNVTKYVGYAYIINLKAKQDNDEITSEDLKPFEALIKKYKRIILQTNWSKHFSEEKFYTNFPIITEDAANYLVKCGIVLIGLETPSVNRAKHREVHTIFLSNDVAIVESLANLDKIENNVIFFSAAPLGIKDGDGFPVRALAVDINT